MTKDLDDPARCVLCGSPDRDMKSDHLRQVWWSKAQERLHPSYFMPVLTYDEKYILRQGENHVCASRRACRRRQKPLVIKVGGQALRWHNVNSLSLPTQKRIAAGVKKFFKSTT